MDLAGSLNKSFGLAIYTGSLAVPFAWIPIYLISFNEYLFLHLFWFYFW